MHEIIITIACMAGFFLIGEAASWPMLFVAGYLWELL